MGGQERNININIKFIVSSEITLSHKYNSFNVILPYYTLSLFVSNIKKKNLIARWIRRFWHVKKIIINKKFKRIQLSET